MQDDKYDECALLSSCFKKKKKLNGRKVVRKGCKTKGILSGGLTQEIPQWWREKVEGAVDQGNYIAELADR